VTVRWRSCRVLNMERTWRWKRALGRTCELVELDIAGEAVVVDRRWEWARIDDPFGVRRFRNARHWGKDARAHRWQVQLAASGMTMGDGDWSRRGRLGWAEAEEGARRKLRQRRKGVRPRKTRASWESMKDPSQKAAVAMKP
jgi:hypothetical protein